MKIVIDTAEDSDKEIREAIQLLKKLTRESTKKDYKTDDENEFDPSEDTGDGGIFGAFDDDEEEDDEEEAEVEIVNM